MAVLFLIIILKRMILEGPREAKILIYHFAIIGGFMVSLKFYQHHDVAMRIVPLLIGIMSFFSHTKLLF